MTVLFLVAAIAGCSSSGSGTSASSQPAGATAAQSSTAPSPTASAPAASSSAPASSGGAARLFAAGARPCALVDVAALGAAAGMTLVKTIPSADNGCLWGTSKIGVGVQVSLHPGWTMAYIDALKAHSTATVTDVTLPGATAAVVVRAAVGTSELDNLYALFPQGGVEVAETGPPATATMAAVVAATGVILG